MVIVPDVLVKVPPTERFPVMVKDEAVLTEPLTVKLSIEMPVPLIVLVVPLIVMVPPEVWVNEPEPVVAMFPVTVKLLFAIVTAAPVTVKLLKFCAPAPLIAAPDPLKVTVPVLPLKVPLLVQSPPTV